MTPRAITLGGAVKEPAKLEPRLSPQVVEDHSIAPAEPS